VGEHALTRRFTFDLFRLNVEDHSDLFTEVSPTRIRTDAQIAEVLKIATEPEQDKLQTTRSAVYKWSVRNYKIFANEHTHRPMLYLVLARSVLERDGTIVTDEGMSTGTSLPNPPLASTAVCLFDLARHLVVVEHTGELFHTAWKDQLEQILMTASARLQLWSAISLEPIPENNGIVGLFKSFERLTRMRVTLRIPNPELTRYTKILYKDLVDSEIREMTQDMKNPNGLSKAETARPFASAVLAEQGYKKGEVQFEGLRNGAFEHASSGSVATRGSVRGFRDFVRGLHANAKTKETQNVLAAVTAEIDRIHPLIGLNG